MPVALETATRPIESGEPNTSCYALNGRYEQDFTRLPTAPFGGFLFRDDNTGRVIGRIIDPLGSADVLGRMKKGRLFFMKFYDPQILTLEDHFGQPTPIVQDTPQSQVPIFYRLAQNEIGAWEGKYRIPGGRSGEVQCVIGDLNTEAPLFTFEHDDPYSRSRYDEVFFSFSERIRLREEVIFRYRPERRSSHARGRIEPSTPMLQF